MASEWPIRKLADLCYSVDYGYTASAKEMPCGPKFLRITDIVSGGINWDSVPFCEIDNSARARYLLHHGEVVIARTGATTGYSAYIDNPPDAVFASYLVRLKIGPEADSRFIAYFLQSHRFWSYMRGVMGDKSAQPNASAKTMTQVTLPLPSVKHQQAVACILGALDDKIVLNRRMNETLEAMARATFKSWFVDFDPVRAKAAGATSFCGMPQDVFNKLPNQFTDSELGLIPEGWATASLGELSTKIGSGATPRGGGKAYVDEGVALIRSQNVFDNEFKWDGLARITDDAADKLRGVTVERNDILFNITGVSILRTCVVDPSVLPARVNQHVAIIRTARGIPHRYLHEYLVRPEMKAYLIGFNTGATREAVTKGHLEGVPVVLPDVRVLAEFDRLTAPLYTEAEQHTSQSRTLAALRVALLPKLISGDLRVPDAERIVGRCV